MQPQQAPGEQISGGGIVRTVRGDIEASELGATDAHEHLFFVSPIQPGEEYSEMAPAIAEAHTLVKAGVRSLVDWTPLGLGRSLAGLLSVSEATGLHVVAATGVHRSAHYPDDDLLRSKTAEELTERFVADITASDVRAGIVKVGASYHHLAGFEQTVFAAAGEAHRRTGAPVCVHTEHGTMGLELVGHLGAVGVAPNSVILAHLDRNPDAGELAEIASTGAWLELDGPGRTKYWPDCTIISLIEKLAELGCSRCLLLGGDIGRRSMMRAYGGGPGLDYLFAKFKPRLERELGTELSREIFVENPARAFAFQPPDSIVSMASANGS